MLTRAWAPVALALTLLTTPAPAQTVKVGVMGPFSGPYALFGKNFKIGIDAYAAAHGDTVAGRKIEFIYRDLPETNPAQARALAQELVVKDGVQYLAGVVFTPNAMAIAPLVNQAKVPFVVFNATSPAVTSRSPLIVRTSFTLPQIATPMGPAAVKRGVRKVVTVVTDYAPGLEAEGAFKAAFQAAGGTVVDGIRLPLKANDFAPIMQRVKDSGADALFAFLPAGPSAVSFTRAYIENGLRERGIKFLTTGDLTQEPDLPSIGEAGVGVLSVFHYATSHDSDANRAFLAQARRVASADATAVTFSAVGAYDGAHLIYRMVEATGGRADAAKAVEAVKGLAWESPRGPVRVDPMTRHVRQTVYLRELVKLPDGSFANREIESFPDQPDQLSSASN